MSHWIDTSNMPYTDHCPHRVLTLKPPVSVCRDDRPAKYVDRLENLRATIEAEILKGTEFLTLIRNLDYPYKTVCDLWRKYNGMTPIGRIQIQNLRNGLKCSNPSKHS